MVGRQSVMGFSTITSYNNISLRKYVISISLSTLVQSLRLQVTVPHVD